MWRWSNSSVSRKKLNDLLRDVSKKDEDAFYEVALRLEPALLKVIGSVSQDFSSFHIDDVYSKTLEKIWEKSRTFRGLTEGEAWSWVRTIARNKAYDEIAKLDRHYKKNEQLVVIIDDDEDSYDHHALEAPEHYEQMESKDAMDAFLASLSSREREILEMRFKGFSQKEIAKRLSISEGLVSRIKGELLKRKEKLFS